MIFKIKPCFIVLSLLCSLLVVSCNNSSPDTKQTTSPPKKAKTIELQEETEYKNFSLPKWPIKQKFEKGKVLPFDEGPINPVFNSFRQKLYNAVKQKDADYILSIIPDQDNPPEGIDPDKYFFLDAYELDKNPKNPKFWKALTLCLEFGGGFKTYGEDKMFFAPFVSVADSNIDPFDDGVILGENVRLREKPDSKSKIVAKLSWDHYTLIPQEGKTVSETINGENHAWIFLKTKKGKTGYVFGKYARSSVDYRVGFTEVASGKWKMTHFTAGD